MKRRDFLKGMIALPIVAVLPKLPKQEVFTTDWIEIPRQDCADTFRLVLEEDTRALESLGLRPVHFDEEGFTLNWGDK